MHRTKTQFLILLTAILLALVSVSCGSSTEKVVNEFIVTIDPAWQRHPAISESIVVWQDRSSNLNDNIYGYNLSNAEELVISDGQWLEKDPDISGNTVVWADNRNGNWDIYAYNLQTRKELAITTDPEDQFSPAIDGIIVVWVDERNGG